MGRAVGGGIALTALRIGAGYDAHRLVAGGPLRLGGIEIPGEHHLEGHSDGDCLFHAIGDSLLGAIAAGDMGAHFPSSDPRWREAASRVFLEAITGLVAAAGYSIVNIDATLIAQSPRLAPHLKAMREATAAALHIDASCISVKVKSADHLGALGRSEGIAAQAVALVMKD